MTLEIAGRPAPQLLREQAPAQDYKIETPYEFLDHFTQSAKKAREKAWFRTMYFEVDDVFRPVAAALKEGAGRDVDARFITDYFTFMFTDGNINWLPNITPGKAADLRRKQQAKFEAIDELRAAGVHVTITNVPGIKERIFPVRGRSHIKGARVDDAAWGGGLNVSKKDFDRPDTMLYTHEPVTVAALSEQFIVDNMRRGKRVDRQIPISASTSVLIDGGIPGHSLILDEANSLITGSTDNVTVVSQFFPDKYMLGVLAEAQHNNVDARVITSDNRHIHELFARVYSKRTEIFSRFREQTVPITYFPDWVHIKAILGDLGTSHPWAMYGTHNFLRFGVQLGTEEVAIKTRDPHIVREVSKAVKPLDLQHTVFQQQGK